MSRTTNKEQYKKIVDLLGDNVDIAQGYTKKEKHEVIKFWEKCAVECNAMGPPTKDGTSWKKVWIDYKSYVKKKLTHNKKEVSATGGGRNKLHTFSDLENDVIRLTGMDKNVSGISGTLAFGLEDDGLINENQTTVQSGENEASGLLDVSMQCTDEHFERPRSRSTTNTLKKDTHNLLKEQMQSQQEFYENISNFFIKQEKQHLEMSTNIKKVYRGIDKLCDLRKAELEETRRHNMCMEKLTAEKIAIKLQMLEISRSNLE